jgi:hypothetical protein
VVCDDDDDDDEDGPSEFCVLSSVSLDESSVKILPHHEALVEGVGNRDLTR